MMPRRIAFPALLLALLSLFALWLSWFNLNAQLPRSDWWQALAAPDVNVVDQMLFHYSALPRLAISLLVGAGLGLVGVLFQQVLRNPLAEPTTLGVATGAQLGITITTLWALPGGYLVSQFAALAGACLVGLLVFGVAWGKRLSPVTLILAGLVVSLYCGAVNQLMAIFHHEQLQSMFLWSTGALNQTDWNIVQRLWPQLLGGAILTLLLLRPLTLMGLDDGVARNLGLALSLARFAALALAIVLSALLVNAVGIVGFIGLFAPLLAKMLGARRLLSRLLLSALIGALILWVADQLVVWLTRVWMEVSTGSITALIGAPLLLWLLPRLRTMTPAMNAGDSVPAERQHRVLWTLAGLAVLAAFIVLALSLGRDAQGWVWASGDTLSQLMPWRWPRVAAALIAGAMLAVAGCIIQRLTGNPMASPEVLGISSGAAFGVVLMLFFVPGNAFGWLLPAGSLGAAATLLIIMVAAGRGGFSPHRMLLAGMALSTAFTMLLMMLQASGDPRMAQVLTWISGSTYTATAQQVASGAVVMVVLFILTPLCRRWLTVLPLGGETARAVGMALTTSRVLLLLLAASLTACATLIIGPLSFIGLMAPHIARMMGFRRTMPHIVMSTLIGAMLMVFADWAGRMVMFPYQIPAGLLSSFIGAPYFIYLLRKQSR